MREASCSQGSRTSSSVNVSPFFCSDLTCPGEISKSIRESTIGIRSAVFSQLRRTCQRGQTHQGGQQENPDNVGRGSPPVVRPVILVTRDVAERKPGEVGATEEAGHAPQRRAAHQVAGTVGLLRPAFNLRVFYLPVHFGGRFSRKAMIPSRASSVETSSSRYIF